MIRSIGVKNLNKTSIRKINRMIAAVLAEPKLYNQNTFGETTNEEKPTICNTVCCAAGWAVFLNNRSLYSKLMKIQLADNNTYPPWEDEALKALGLEEVNTSSYNQVSSLFSSASSWPEPFCDDYQDATTPKQRAKVFAARWRKFIQSDGTV
jgi:hypothetical protein